MEDITKYLTTQEALYSAPIPIATATYSPVSNQQLIETIEEQLYKNGFEITNRVFRSANPDKMIGLYNLNRSTSDMNLMLGFGNSYDKSAPIKLSSGARVMACSNGCISGEYMFKRKHTGSVYHDMLHFVSENIKTLDETFHKMEVDFNKLKEVEVSDKAVAEIIGKMFLYEDILNSAQLGIVKSELEKPTYVEFKDMSGYSLYNHVTHALKTEHPNTTIKKLVKTHNFMIHELLEV